MILTSFVALFAACSSTGDAPKSGDGAPGAEGEAPPTGPIPGANEDEPGPRNVRLEAGVDVGGFGSDVVRWMDASGHERRAAMVRNDKKDPTSHWGGFLREYAYVRPNGQPLEFRSRNPNHPGFGQTVSHLDGGGAYASTLFQKGSYREVLLGRNHAIHEYRWTVSFGPSPVDITIHWFFAAGRDHPVWSITYDCSKVGPNVINADDRSPYGDLEWAGDAKVRVDGVGWGDRYKFRTTSALSTDSSWDYSQPNTIPYVHMWSESADAEQGSVQTQDFRQRDAGGGWFYPNWGRTSDNKVVSDGSPVSQSMPLEWNWTYQLDQYELPDATSKRMAWGSNFGAIGKQPYDAYGGDKQLSDFPRRSRSVFYVAGAHSKRSVERQIENIEASLKTKLTASRGRVRERGPAGVGRTDEVTYAPAGWSFVYGAWDIEAEANGFAVTFDTGGGALEGGTVLSVRNWAAATAPATLTIGGQTVAEGSGFWGSVDRASQTLWITLTEKVEGNVSVEVGP